MEAFYNKNDISKPATFHVSASDPDAKPNKGIQFAEIYYEKTSTSTKSDRIPASSSTIGGTCTGGDITLPKAKIDTVLCKTYPLDSYLKQIDFNSTFFDDADENVLCKTSIIFNKPCPGQIACRVSGSCAASEKNLGLDPINPIDCYKDTVKGVCCEPLPASKNPLDDLVEIKITKPSNGDRFDKDKVNSIVLVVEVHRVYDGIESGEFVLKRANAKGNMVDIVTNAQATFTAGGTSKQDFTFPDSIASIDSGAYTYIAVITDIRGKNLTAGTPLALAKEVEVGNNISYATVAVIGETTKSVPELPFWLAAALFPLAIFFLLSTKRRNAHTPK